MPIPRDLFFNSLSLHGFHRVAYREWGAHRQPASRRLRPRLDAQRTGFRRPGGRARAVVPRALSRYAGSRRQRVAARSERLQHRHLSDHAGGDARACPCRASGLGRHIDGRTAWHGDGGASRERRSRGLSSTTSARSSSPRRSRASRPTSGSILCSSPSARSRLTSARSPRRLDR